MVTVQESVIKFNQQQKNHLPLKSNNKKIKKRTWHEKEFVRQQTESCPIRKPYSILSYTKTLFRRA